VRKGKWSRDGNGGVSTGTSPPMSGWGKTPWPTIGYVFAASINTLPPLYTVKQENAGKAIQEKPRVGWLPTRTSSTM